MSTEIWVAVVAAIPPTMVASLGWLQGRRTHAEVRTNNGKRAGEYIEEMPKHLIAHYQAEEGKFDALHSALSRLGVIHEMEARIQAELREIDRARRERYSGDDWH